MPRIRIPAATRAPPRCATSQAETSGSPATYSFTPWSRQVAGVVTCRTPRGCRGSHAPREIGLAASPTSTRTLRADCRQYSSASPRATVRARRRAPVEYIRPPVRQSSDADVRGPGYCRLGFARGRTRGSHRAAPRARLTHMPLITTLYNLLRSTPGDAVCDACLAFACKVSLIEIREITEALVRVEPEHFQHAASCASCRRRVPSVAYK
jgi:hypothetical protein